MCVCFRQSGTDVRVFFYLEDRERTLDFPIEKLILDAQAMSDEMDAIGIDGKLGCIGADKSNRRLGVIDRAG